jgi:DNA-binding GntR family transcriptional regulator
MHRAPKHETTVKNPTRSTAQRLRDTLEEDIVRGEFTPGERLDEVGLTERFGVSRTPVREALQQLAAVGLVETIPKRGAFVARVGLPELVEMFEVMAELEGMCARLAARRITDSEAAALRESLEACERAAEGGDSDAYYYENERFHACIYAASHNGFLMQQAHQLKTRLHPYRRLQLKVRNRVQRSLEEHRGIVQAIMAGDAARAEICVKQHVKIQGERFEDFIASVVKATAPSTTR